MDDDYVVLAKEWDKTQNKDSLVDMSSLSGVSMADPGEQPELPYVKNRTALRKNHPLSYLVEYEREELITHPLIISLYSAKWRSFGFWIYYGNLTLYIFFMILLNMYAYTIPPPYSVNKVGCVKMDIYF